MSNGLKHRPAGETRSQVAFGEVPPSGIVEPPTRDEVRIRVDHFRYGRTASYSPDWLAYMT